MTAFDSGTVGGEPLFSRLFESAPDAMVVVDQAGIIVLVNAQTERMFGYARIELLGGPVETLVPERFRSGHRTHRDGHAKRPWPREIGAGPDLYGLRKNGEEFPVEISLSPLKTEQGVFVSSAIRDITDRTRMERALSETTRELEQARHAQERADTLAHEILERSAAESAVRRERDRAQRYLDTADVILVALDLDGRITLINRKGCDLLERPESELLGRNWIATCLPARIRDALSGTFSAVIGGDLRVVENPILTRSGSERLIEWRNTPLRDETAQVIGTFSSGTDITERRHAEEAQRTSEARYRTLFDYAPDGIVIADRDGCYIDANASMCRMLGYTREEFVGLHASDIVSAAEVPHVAPALRAITAASDYRREWEFRRKDGSVFAAEVISTVMPDGHRLAMIRDVSERNRSVAALRTTEERMRFALENANVGIWDMDLTTGVLRWSETLEAQHGLAAGSFAGTFEAFLERIHPDDRAALVEAIEKESRAGTDFSMEHRAIWPDGTVRWLSGAGRTMRDEDGRPVRALGISQDVTEQRQAASTLRQSEARKAAILDSVLDCIVTMDADGRVIEFNAAAERTFGYARADVLGRALADLIIPPTLRAAHAAGLAGYLGTGAGSLLGTVVEVTAMRSNGTEIPVELSITAITSDQAPMFTGVLRDISARKQFDETRARLASIVDTSDDAIVSIALDETIVSWNAGAERLYGYTAAEVIGRSRTFVVPSEKTAELGTIMERATRAKAREPFETQRTRKDGSTVDVSLTISPMMDPSGRVIGVSTIARDITNRKRAEAELTRLNAEIQLQRLRVFKATMRTVQDIVNNLLNGLQLIHLDQGHQPPAEIQALVDQAIHEAAVKLRMLGDLETVREREMAAGLGIDYPGA